MLWNIQSEIAPTNVSELITTLLNNRGIKDVNEFLNPIFPERLTPEAVGIDAEALQQAVHHIERAKRNNLSIVVYGDYDCDGVCATAVLWETLYTHGCKVIPFIPHREKHGYGLSTKALDEILQGNRPDILITVDNGIVANEQFQRLHDAGVFTILTDHHQLDNKVPPADIILHTTKLCGTTVAWMLAKAINAKHAATLLDLCAIATIADQVELTGPNRAFAYYGLRQLNETKRLGLLLLLEAAGLTLGEIDSYAVNFGIAPRINAMGRLEHAIDALRALCTRNQARGQELIAKLEGVNQTRQDITQTLIEKARSRQEEWANEPVIVVEDSEFHEGVIGLIASRLTEEFHKPAICISIGSVSSKASCRSIPGVHITNLLRQLRGDLMEIGGHPLAAGFRIETTKISVFKEHLAVLARQEIKTELLVPSINVDCVLPLSLLNLETAKAIGQLEPYGVGNREPLFALEKLEILETMTVGKEGKHLKLKVRPTDSQTVIDVIGFNQGKYLSTVSEARTLDIVGMLQINEWKGRSKTQVVVKDIKLPD